MNTNLMTKSKLFECALGFHEYTIPDKDNPNLLICEHCKRFGKCENIDRSVIPDISSHGINKAVEGWYEFDGEGNLIHYKSDDSDDEFECWYKYDDKGNNIHFKNSNGYEEWLHKGDWVTEKPKNWEYEKLSTF